MADKIIVQGLEVSGRHGCSAAERKQPQNFIVDAELFVDLSQAGKTDDLGDTVDYASVIADIHKVVSATSHNLIETVAQDIADFLLRKYFLLDAVKITMRKLKSPVKEKFSCMAVEVIRRRSK